LNCKAILIFKVLILWKWPWSAPILD